MLIENGALRRVDDRWVAAGDLSRITIPPTIQALLAARIDRLDEADRAVLDPASIIGLVFAIPALDSLVDGALRSDLAIHLDSLTDKELRPTGSATTADARRFGHILIRDADLRRPAQADPGRTPRAVRRMGG